MGYLLFRTVRWTMEPEVDLSSAVEEREERVRSEDERDDISLPDTDSGSARLEERGKDSAKRGKSAKSGKSVSPPPKKKSRKPKPSAPKKGKDALLAQQGFSKLPPDEWVAVSHVPGDSARSPRSIAVELRGGNLGGIGSFEFNAYVPSAERGEGWANLAAVPPRYPIIASHGLRGRRQDLFFLLSLLLPLYPITFFDARGHGDSAPRWVGAPESAFSWESMAHDYLAVSKFATGKPELSQHIPGTKEKVVLVGKSMSTAAALYAMGQHGGMRESVAAAVLYKVPTTGERRRERGKDLAVSTEPVSEGGHIECRKTACESALDYFLIPTKRENFLIPTYSTRE